MVRAKEMQFGKETQATEAQQKGGGKAGEERGRKRC